MKESAGEAYDATKRAASKLGETIVEAGGLVKDKVGDAFVATKNAAIKAEESTVSGIKSAGEFVKDAAVRAKDIAAEKIEHAAQAVHSGGGSQTNSTKSGWKFNLETKFFLFERAKIKIKSLKLWN